MANLPVYQMLVEEDDTGISRGVSAVSLVDDPAIKVNFLTFKKAEKIQLALDGARQILTGPIMIPDQKVYRTNDTTGEEYYVTATAQQIEKAALKFAARGYYNASTHMHDVPLEGNTVFESWLIQDPQSDKATALGFKNLPAGTWMVSMKIGSKGYWDSEIATGKVRGFSLEGFFKLDKTEATVAEKDKQPVIMKEQTLQNKLVLALHKAGIIKLSTEELAKLEKETAPAAETSVEAGKKKDEEAKQEAMEAMVTEDGDVFIMKDGKLVPAPDGEYMINGQPVKVMGGEVATVPAAAADPAKAEAVDNPTAVTAMAQSIKAQMSAEFAEQLKPITEALAGFANRIAAIENAKPKPAAKAVNMTETVAVQPASASDDANFKKAAELLGLAKA